MKKDGFIITMFETSHRIDSPYPFYNNKGNDLDVNKTIDEPIFDYSQRCVVDHLDAIDIPNITLELQLYEKRSAIEIQEQEFNQIKCGTLPSVTSGDTKFEVLAT